ncbi:MAG TPA: hypothetical protein VGM39_21320 [Kofleriaceae bacterium]
MQEQDDDLFTAVARDEVGLGGAQLETALATHTPTDPRAAVEAALAD